MSLFVRAFDVVALICGACLAYFAFQDGEIMMGLIGIWWAGVGAWGLFDYRGLE